MSKNLELAKDLASPPARAAAFAALAAWQRGELDPAGALQRLWPVVRDAADHSNLGAVLRALGRNEEAEAAYRRAATLDPGFPAAHFNLGNLLGEAGRLDEAEAGYRTALALRPDYAEAWNAIGTVLQRRGRLADAAASFAQAARHAPRWAEARTNLGVALLGLEQYQDAAQALRTALTVAPRSAAALGNLGAVCLRAGCAVAAERSSRDALALTPHEHRWISNLATALQMQCRHAESEVCYREALALRPDYATGHGNLLFALNYRDDLPAEAIFAEYQRWDAQHARRLAPVAPPCAVDRTPGRRLRVGYVSPDFRQHAVALFAEPLLAAHDRDQVELFCYAEIAVEDAVTARFRALAEHWRPTLGLSDEAMAERIRQDRIDVLVDLAGHTAGNRLLVFARKPAPVQVEYMLGHGYSSGLSAMDAFLADEALAPPGAESLFSERLVRLPRIPLAYQAPEGMPEVAARDGPAAEPDGREPEQEADAPALLAARHGLTFGYFGRPERLNAGVIATWARILQALPGSRLVLNSRNFQEAAFRALFAERFAATGIEADRIAMLYTTPQPNTWAAYGEIDIALDPFPHNAGTTTIEALYQGVPVLTLAGRPSVGRFGAAILHAIGLDDWITDTADAYVARAVAAAADPPALARLRGELRPRFLASPLNDAASLARAVEDAYRSLWEDWRACDPDELRRRFTTGDLIGADALANRMLARNPTDPDAAHVAGLIAHRQQRLADADRHLRVTLAATPDNPEALANHAAILRALGRLPEAEAAARASLTHAPDRAETHNNLGNILRDAGRYPESIAAFQLALEGNPRFADAWVNLAWVLTLQGLPAQAEQAARRAIACDAENANGHNNLGLALMRQSRLREAEAALRQALALRPDFALPHSNILFCLNYRDDMTAEAIFAEYRAWDERHAHGLLPDPPQYSLGRTPGRRLRVGYVSPDFRQHAVALFAEPLIAAHDREQVELFCYAELAVEDTTTQRIRAMVDHWRPTIGLTDDALAAMIRQDGIDVLVDLAGHTAGNRLLTFARKPAPVQVEYMLGHGYSSGMSAMDAFLADERLAPPGAETLFSEHLIRLPRIPLVYRPPENMPPVAPLPAAHNGWATFGYFGRTVRLNEAVIATWARILLAVPGARLVLNSGPFAEPAARADFAARFAAQGVDRDRLDLICTTPQPRTWEAYGTIDIALDPFPHNAGTTTIEALYQGVPVLTLAGRPSVGRFGPAILHAVGLDDWITNDADAYVTRAVEAASDLGALTRLRAELRDRFIASPLHDAAGLARTVEAAYRDLWDTWREGAVPRMQRLFAAGDYIRAEALARRVLARTPDDADALHVLGLSAYRAGAADRAVPLLQRAAPRADILSNLGVMLRAQGRLAEAEQAYRAAVALDPGLVPALGNLGTVLLDQRRPEEAETVLVRALELAPDEAWLLRGLALSKLARSDSGGAEPLLRQALSVVADDPDVHETLGALLGQTGRPVEAEAHHRAGLRGLKDRHRGLSNLAVSLQMQCRHAESEVCYREALALRPDYATGHGNLLFALNYRDDLPAEAIFAEYQRWDAQHARRLAPVAPPCAVDRTPGRKLRVGYVSPDFRQHAVALFAEPLLAAHDRDQVELFCYAEIAVEDAVTARFRALAEHWRPTLGLSDEAMAERIRQDRIDVLVDLAGHTAGNRLLVFARKPAPVQVEYMLGHGYSSGLSAMDAFLADEALAPPGAEMLFSERLVRLPRIPLAYQAPEGMPEVAARDGPAAEPDGREPEQEVDAPALLAARHGLTFGYFGRPERLNAGVIATWARILQALPGSRLVLNSRNFQEAAFRALFAERFAATGIEADRIAMLYTTPQPNTWAAYGEIDIALDPFPHNAGTTTIEALYQGVPVLTLAGRPSVGRFGAAILHAIGLDDWITDTADAYVARAVAAAADPPALARLRGELRPRFLASPLNDAASLARAVEDAYRSLWEDWNTAPAFPAAAE